jgi:hypothetical protein
MHLYELTKELQQLSDALMGITEVPLSDDEIRVKLDQFGAQFEYKAEQVAKMIRNYEANAAALENEEVHLAARRKALENKVKFFKSYLLQNMTALEITSVKGDILNITVRNNPLSVTVVNLLDIPESFTRIIPEHREADKTKIIDTFKESGEMVPGTEITRTKRIEIK